MLELIPDRSGMRVARGIAAAGLISAVMWVVLVAIPFVI